MMERLMARAEALASAAQRAKIQAVANRLKALLGEAAVQIEDAQVSVRGRGITKRWLIDPSLRFLAGGLTLSSSPGHSSSSSSLSSVVSSSHLRWRLTVESIPPRIPSRGKVRREERCTASIASSCARCAPTAGSTRRSSACRARPRRPATTAAARCWSRCDPGDPPDRAVDPGR